MKTAPHTYSRIFFYVIIAFAAMFFPATCLAGTISGNIRNDVGNPLENVSVQAYSGQCHNGNLGQSTTDASGDYSIAGIPDGTQAYVYADSSLTGQNLTHEWYDGAAGIQDCWSAQPVDDDASNVHFVLERSGSITGTVTDNDDSPIGNIQVYATINDVDCNGYWLSGANTDPTTGVYQIDHIPPGEVVIRTCSECSGLNYVNEFYDNVFDCNSAAPIEVAAGNIAHGYDFQLDQGGAITGHVYQAGTTTGIEGVTVHIYSDYCYNGQMYGEHTDEDGYFAFRGLPLGGQYILRADSNNENYYISQWYNNVTDIEDCNNASWVTVGDDVVFNMVQGGAVSGTARDSGGNPITGVSVDVSIIQGDPCGNHLYVMGRYSNPFDGSFSLNGIPQGNYFLRTYPAESNYVSEWWTDQDSDSSPDCNDAVEFTVTAGDTSSGFEFRLEEGATISGHVYQQDGTTPIENVDVYVTNADTGQWIGGDNTDATGLFSVTGLPPGECLVHICPSCSELMYVDELYDDTYNQSAATRISLASGSDINLGNILLATGNTISGTISGLDPNQWLHIAINSDNGTPEGEDDLNFGRGYPADASGNVEYTITVLPGHLYRIQIFPDNDPSVFYLQGNLNGIYAHGLATLVDPTTNPNNINIQITQGVQLSGTINGLDIDQHVWINAHCENGTPNDDTDDFSFGMEIWGDGTGADTFSMAVPAGFTYRFCFGQDNGITACYDGTDDGTFGGIDPNVVVNGDYTLDPIAVTPAAMINGTVDNLNPDQFVEINVQSADFSYGRDFNADSNGVLNYGIPVPINYSYIVQFQPENIPSVYYLESDPNGTPFRNLATEFLADADVNGVNLTIAASGSISGNVSSGGQPVEGIAVQVFSTMCGDNDWENYHLGGVLTDVDGNYQMDGLPVTDVYVLACPGCDNRNYMDHWYDIDGGIEDCNQALPVSVFDGGMTPSIDFELPKGPRILHWMDVAVYHGHLAIGFDLLPGFDSFLESAEVEGPNGFTYSFDLQTDVLEWLNECSYLVAWNHDFFDLETIDYGEYTLALTFKNGLIKTYTHELVQVDVSAVASESMSHTVNDDGSIDFAWTNPDPNQRYQVRIYLGDERLYRSGMLSTESLHVSPDSLKCLVLGEEVTWQIRAYDDHDPYYTCEKSESLPLIYNPGSLENRAKWFSATNYRGTESVPVNKLSPYFDARPGSRYNIISASIAGPTGFTPYDVDLVNDWFDISTETRKNSGWSAFIPEPIFDGAYTLTVTFSDGYIETRPAYNLSAEPLTMVDVTTMNHEIYENGAMGFSWNLPQGVTGQRYNVRVRSMDGLQEFVKSGTFTDATQMYLSAWDLRALIHGQTFKWFVQANSADGDTWIRSDSINFVYDPFQMFPLADTDKDGDVDGSDLAVVAQMIYDGVITDVSGALSDFAPRYGQPQ